ncbi:MAG TPA: RNA polymerase sigma-54 factor [Acidisarcina sp.]|nr:RNA polymerase sigma-54 factor [Acidisarcina sp.]
MSLLQPKLSLKVSQRQVLTPGLMQMVSVLALNKLELKEMINAEIVENPVLEELDENVPLLDEVAGREAERERSVEEVAADAAKDEKSDPFEEIDFGSYFQDYLDPGYRTQSNFEISDKPSFENFLSQPSTLTDHLFWQLGSLSLSPAVREAAEYLIGNLDEDGYLTATDEELLEGFLRETLEGQEAPLDLSKEASQPHGGPGLAAARSNEAVTPAPDAPGANGAAPRTGKPMAKEAVLNHPEAANARRRLKAALAIVQGLDPVGIAARDLRDCLLLQVRAQAAEFDAVSAEHQSAAKRAAATEAQEILPTAEEESTSSEASVEKAAEEVASSAADSDIECRKKLFECVTKIVESHLSLLQKRDLRELAKAVGRPLEQVQRAFEFIRTLDPRPGQRYNRSDARLIEPDVAFVKRGDEYVVVMNEEDLPTLRLNQGYRKLLSQDGTEKDVKDYVKERYRSALQLMRNIEQRKNTILRTCESIVRRQQEFLEYGVEALKPMMIKEVAEEIGVHPSTVSRAVSSKYVHTSQGVFELRFFFSEGVNGPEGAGTPLMLLKRKVKKLIEDEDSHKPLTDDQIAHLLQTQGINVTRRTVAKYREDMHIPSTHQRRVRD